MKWRLPSVGMLFLESTVELRRNLGVILHPGENGAETLQLPECQNTENLDVLGASQTPEKNEDGVLFREDFNNLDLNKWKRTIKISGEDDEFTIYTANYENSHVHDGNLVIVPTIEEDDFVRRGSVRLTK
ncbi:hypothetical protein AAG570_003383 [Ranatra chinensis]|uniref:Uncharacterized protein n=1 Tax=Ranatra chinensis TaxID=642074 RepID=A0ABD0Y3I3_9HEMI